MSAAATSPQSGPPADERVVLLDEGGHRIGTMAKGRVHHQTTPLHLAFSCHVFNVDGDVLLTQRAQHKTTWPGVWTNSFCGHPAPGEDVVEAVRRRAWQELGLHLHGVCLVLPRFRYAATMDDGVRENELCPVFTATVDQRVRPNAAEVAAVDWVPWAPLRAGAGTTRSLSPWCAGQLPLLPASAPDGCVCHPEALAALPPAARAASRDARLHPHPR